MSWRDRIAALIIAGLLIIGVIFSFTGSVRTQNKLLEREANERNQILLTLQNQGNDKLSLSHATACIQLLIYQGAPYDEAAALRCYVDAGAPMPVIP